MPDLALLGAIGVVVSATFLWSALLTLAWMAGVVIWRALSAVVLGLADSLAYWIRR